MKRFFFIAYIFKTALALSQTQPKPLFIFPLENKKELNGNYGEVRPNHFHAGLDFKTHPTQHLPIHAAMDGYVSRIKVSTYGYGKVLYVTHPNGLVSVYAHQHHFADKIKAYVENAQEIAETFEIELFPKPNELPVKQGEIIGYTGNTGGSEGPHLHFEIRDEKTEIPYNPLHYLTVNDVVPPKIKRVAVYEGGNFKKLFSIPAKNDTIIVNQDVAFGIECIDYEKVNGNKNNIYKAEIYVDDKLFYRHVLDSIPFDLARYVNAYADYDLKKQKGITIQKLWKEKNNDLPIYKVMSSANSHNGNIWLINWDFHKIKIIVYDFYNQKDEVSFFIKTNTIAPFIHPSNHEHDCFKTYNISEDNYSIELPAKSLYRDVQLSNSYKNNVLSFTAKDYNVPFQNNCIIKLKTPENLIKYNEKLCITELKTPKKGFINGAFDSGFVKGNIKNFGFYKVDVDTIAPQIKLIPHKNNIYKKGSTISFKVTDDFSGIGVFKLFVNGKFHLSEYEHKNNTVFFTLDEKIPTGKILLNLQVNDKKNNQATYQTTLTVISL